MSATAGAETASSGADTSERSVLLLWMIFTGLSFFAVVVLWRYGLLHLMVVSDRTYISSVIAVLYVVTCFHCFWRTRAIAREGEVTRRCRAILSVAGGAMGLDEDARALPGGLVTDHIVEPAVAEVLDLTPAYVKGVVTFYTMYHTHPVGRHFIQVCTTSPCNICGAEAVMRAVLQESGCVELGATSPDGRFTVMEVECLGACGFATPILIDDDFIESVTPEKVPGILQRYQ